MRFSISILLLFFLGKLSAQNLTEETRGAIPVLTDSEQILGEQISYHAIMFAVEDYDDPNIRDLEHPVTDAKNLRDVLIEKYGFKSNHVKLLINPTESQIIQTLNSAVESYDSEQNLMIFFAGHGTWNEILKEGYWLPSDAILENPSSSIPNSTLLRYIKGIASRHTLVISDACFSGGIVSEPDRSVSQIPKHLRQIHQDKSRKALTSGNKSKVPDESVFMKYLLKYLKQNSDAYLPTSSLYSRLSEPVSKNAIDQYGNGIRPIYAPMPSVGDENGEFIFQLASAKETIAKPINPPNQHPLTRQASKGLKETLLAELMSLDSSHLNLLGYNSYVNEIFRFDNTPIDFSYDLKRARTNAYIDQKIGSRKYREELMSLINTLRQNGWNVLDTDRSLTEIIDDYVRMKCNIQISLQIQSEDGSSYPVSYFSDGVSTSKSLEEAEKAAFEQAEFNMKHLISHNYSITPREVELRRDSTKVVIDGEIQTIGAIETMFKIYREANGFFQVHIKLLNTNL